MEGSSRLAFLQAGACILPAERVQRVRMSPEINRFIWVLICMEVPSGSNWCDYESDSSHQQWHSPPKQ